MTILQYPTLQDDAKETLCTLIFSEKQISTRDDRWFSVRIMPYRRLDNVIDGAVITFVDISVTKRLESNAAKIWINDCLIRYRTVHINNVLQAI
ncbi:PAS domain-containing protein [Nitrosomonas sp.]|uniref:PAS domain-containing protein n=1 Tax=Nitrosomonas sp. TaxID=42353 RepID=UPI00374D05FD